MNIQINNLEYLESNNWMEIFLKNILLRKFVLEHGALSDILFDLI